MGAAARRGVAGPGPGQRADRVPAGRVRRHGDARAAHGTATARRPQLDVGTGVGGLAVAAAEALPQVTVVGIDVLPRVLALAEQVRAASPAADRVVLRQQDVTTLDEQDTHDLGWMPAPFVPEPALRPGLSAVTRALRPGGWLMLGHGKYSGDPVDDALNRFTTVAYGGVALDDARAQQALADAGLDAVTTVPTVFGGPAITVGRKPA